MGSFSKYDINSDTEDTLCKESELPSEYDSAVDIDWNKAVEYSHGEQSIVDPLPEGILITHEEAEQMIADSN